MRRRSCRANRKRTTATTTDPTRQSHPLPEPPCRREDVLRAPYAAPAIHVTTTTPQQTHVAISATFPSWRHLGVAGFPGWSHAAPLRNAGATSSAGLGCQHTVCGLARAPPSRRVLPFPERC